MVLLKSKNGKVKTFIEFFSNPRYEHSFAFIVNVIIKLTNHGSGQTFRAVLNHPLIKKSLIFSRIASSMLGSHSPLYGVSYVLYVGFLCGLQFLPTSQKTC